MSNPRQTRLSPRAAWAIALLVAVGIGLGVTADRWLPKATKQVARAVPSKSAAHDDHENEGNHDEHDHDAPVEQPKKAAADHDEHDHDAPAEQPKKTAAKHEDDDHGAHDDESGHDHEPGEAVADARDHEAEEAKAHDTKQTPQDHAHEEASAVKLSRAAQENVGLQLAKVELKPFDRTITVPAMIVERTGRSSIQVAAPLTGVITRVWPLQGETVTPGQPLFELRLTHEEVVEGQAEFLKTAEELDVLQREIDRLQKVAAEGVISGKTVLERTYEQQKLRGAQRSQRQRLLLHGLSEEQIDRILSKRTLLSEMTIAVPEGQTESKKDCSGCILQVEGLKVEKGQHVKAGETLCELADHCELYIQGKAFEQDASMLNNIADKKWPLTAVVDSEGRQREMVTGLRLIYVANKIDPESRAFVFYVQLPNALVRNQEIDGHRFSAWRFKPGQRVGLLVPVERWTSRIVLPAGAVVQDGPESYVFEANQGHFDRRAVRVEYRDEYSVVIANDGALAPGKMVIVSGAYQVHLAMKNKAGGAPDPHAGHNH